MLEVLHSHSFKNPIRLIDTGLPKGASVHRLAASPDGSQVAAAVGSTVKLITLATSGKCYSVYGIRALQSSPGRYEVSKTLPSPSRDGFYHLSDTRIRGRGLHFTRDGAFLVVAYLAHGVL
jgi:hypothetical protein